MAKTILVDAMGDQCPVPVMKTRTALGELPEGGIVTVHVDNEIAVQNLTKMAHQMSITCASEKKEERHFAVTLKTDKGLEPDLDTGIGRPKDGENDIVVIDSAGMGTGNEELGKVLMKGFIYALSHRKDLPKTMLFYNGGATLTTEGSDSIEDLKSMEAQGVELLTCGTCLNYYGLEDKLVVGEVTNMYKIVEIMNGAAKLLKP